MLREEEYWNHIKCSIKIRADKRKSQKKGNEEGTVQ